MIDKVLDLFENQIVCCNYVWDYLFLNKGDDKKKYLVYNTSFDENDVIRLLVTSNNKLFITI